MVDHYEMRAAMNRALEKTDYLDFCNTCKLPSSPNSGDITELFAGEKTYKMWYCDSCLELDYAKV